jgi:hypothetical protein
MRMRLSLMAVSTALAAGLTAGAVQAAPFAGNAGSAVHANAETSALVQKAAYRRCWIIDGVRRCRWFADPYDDYGYYDDDYYFYDGPSYGYGPGVGFFFGGGRHGHGFHRGGGHFRGGHFHGGGRGGGHFHGGGHGGGHRR